ncbi:MAG: glycosyltransferase family 4 protein, partial [Candidatus Binatia bacterium]
MTKLRVAVLSPWCHPWHGYGGLERHVFQLCRSLRREGIEVDLYTSRPWRAEDPLGSDDGFRLVVVPGVPALRRRFLVVATRNVLYPAFSLRMGHRVAAAAGPRGYAAVIAQGLTAFGVAFRTRSLGIRLPLVLNPQGMEEIVTPNAWKRAAYLPFRLLETYAARHAEHVVATDEALVETVEESLAVPAHKIVVIPNAIETEECLAHVTPEGRRRALESTGAAGASPLLVSVGRLAPNKGFDVALEALAALSAELPRSWRWVIAGDGPLRGALARRAAALGLLPHVVFAGALSDADLHNLLSAADLLLH